MAARWDNREDAALSAVNAVTAFQLADGAPVLQVERQAFTGSRLDCTWLSDDEITRLKKQNL